MKMIKLVVPLIMATLVLGFIISAHAAFIDLGGGLVYDDVLDITWLADANYAQTSGYDADGLMTWDQANTFITTLNYGGIGGWRWPTFDPDNPRPGTGEPPTPGPTSANEIGSLLMALTNGGFNLGLPTYTMANISPFYNLPHLISSEYSEVYWTGLACTAGSYSGMWDYYMH